MRYARSICWLRRDLRLSDHVPLAEACADSGQVVVAFVFDVTILSRLADRRDRRVTFIHRSLEELDRELRARGSLLVVRHGDPRVEIPALAEELGAEAVYAGEDYEPAARERDHAVADLLRRAGRDFHPCKDQVIFGGTEVLSSAGTPFRIFTPYKRAWLARLASADHPVSPVAEHRPELDRLAPAAGLAGACAPWTMERIGFQPATLWLEPGADGAARRLERFLPKLDDYADRRDFPAADGTSGLSVHLRFGTISIRRLVRAVLKHPSAGAQSWLAELVWREFYQMILDRFPHVVERAFLPKYDRILWPGREEHFAAWREGRTGYPIVDAAMRHFNETGWMHNRLRMVAASFLVKDLLIDWRLGEAYFADGLLDYELASNNGGWQWSASTGCDAQPWFRIFNPVSQSRKFDPEGRFIRSVLPELGRLSDRSIHWPAEATPIELAAAGVRLGAEYPEPIVDHAAQREKALKLFKFDAFDDPAAP